VIGSVCGLLLGKRRKPSDPAKVEIESDEETEDSTAPIAPVIEMADRRMIDIAT